MGIRSAIGFILLIEVVRSHDVGYTEHDGPHTWGGICGTGNAQSPIDITASAIVPDKTIRRMHFKNYQASGGDLLVENNGHSIKISGFKTWGEKQPYIYGGALEDEYVLQQFHLHWSQDDTHGSEHTIGGLHYPAEIHLVHSRRDLPDHVDKLPPASLAVVGVFVGLGNDGSALRTLEGAIKQVTDGKAKPKKLLTKLNLMDLLPMDLGAFYTYNGSLTTPGCDEVVLWTVLENPISFTFDQLNLIRQSIITHDHKTGFNYRPTQPLNGRKIRYRPAANNMLPEV